jgi:Bifunctional DNA primase/polymerase, N-terminal
LIPSEIEAVALLGWKIYPMSRKSKAGAFKGAADAATHNLDTIEGWCREYPDCNWRVVTGPSGLFALDVDRPGTHAADGFAALKALTEKHGAIPPRPMTRTGGSGGAVLFFKHNGENLIGASGKPAPGLDPHRGRQAIVIPPSRHPITGGSYVWRTPPWEVSPPPIPPWLASLLAPPPEPGWKRHAWTPTDERARNAVMRAVLAVQDAPPGAANMTLNRQAFRLGTWCGAGLLPESDAAESLYSAARQRRIPDREARDTIKSGMTAGLRNPVQSRHVG